MFALSGIRKALLLTLTAATVTVGVILLFFGTDSKTNQANLDFIQSYGWQTEAKPSDIVRLTIPEEFDAVYTAYQDLVQASGFDLTPYKGSHVTRYAYPVLNHRGPGTVYAHVLVNRSGIIAAHLTSPTGEGIFQAITDTTGKTP